MLPKFCLSQKRGMPTVCVCVCVCVRARTHACMCVCTYMTLCMCKSDRVCALPLIAITIWNYGFVYHHDHLTLLLWLGTHHAWWCVMFPVMQWLLNQWAGYNNQTRKTYSCVLNQWFYMVGKLAALYQRLMTAVCEYPCCSCIFTEFTMCQVHAITVWRLFCLP